MITASPIKNVGRIQRWGNGERPALRSITVGYLYTEEQEANRAQVTHRSRGAGNHGSGKQVHADELQVKVMKLITREELAVG